MAIKQAAPSFWTFELKRKQLALITVHIFNLDRQDGQRRSEEDFHLQKKPKLLRKLRILDTATEQTFYTNVSFGHFLFVLMGYLTQSMHANASSALICCKKNKSSKGLHRQFYSTATDLLICVTAEDAIFP